MKNIKIAVLGSTGMLGRYVHTYFGSKGHKIFTFSRGYMNANLLNETDLRVIFKAVGISDGDVVINCIGTIKPRVDELGTLNAIMVNAAFPHILENAISPLGVRLIHPTTDCVFTGDSGAYDENSLPLVTDVYGRTKSLGEPTNSTVIRTSIIGEEIGQGRSLVEWIKSNKDKEVNGFTNHIWNGITCLQFAKVCDQIIEKDFYWKGVRHMYSPTPVTKSGLVQMVSDAYGLNIKVNPIEAAVKCDRTLSTIKDKLDIDIPELIQQIQEMKEFYPILSK